MKTPRCALFIFLFGIIAYSSIGQCVVINEIMINGGGSNDGSNSPNTEEWVEFYNNCDTPVNIGCWAFTDGDFTVTFPFGTTIPANGFYTVGSNNSGFPVDLNWGNCNCTDGTVGQVGIFTNGNEQLVLADNTGQVVDAIMWGTGQLTGSISSASMTGCNSINFVLNNSISFTDIPDTGGNATNGCAVAQTCDGSGVWAVVCGADITPGESNASAVPDVNLQSDQQNICTGDCINFTDLTSPAPTGWTWQFEGANTASSNIQNPTNICYSTAGNYDVTLVVTNACGTFQTALTEYIHVSLSEDLVLSANGPTTFCSGESVTLQTTGTGPFQWKKDGANFGSSTTDNTLVVTQAGIYYVDAASGNCTNASNTIEVIVEEPQNLVITAGGPTTLCDGQSVTLQTIGTGPFEWTLDGVIIPGATSNSYTATEEGVYGVAVTNALCPSTSNTITTTLSTSETLVITAAGPTSFCDGESVVLQTTGGGPFQWAFNGGNIAGGNSNSYTAFLPGIYTVSISNAVCPSTSNSVQIQYLNPVVAVISPNENVTICESETTLQAITAGSVQWYRNGTIIPGEQNTSLLVTSDGTYKYYSEQPNFCGNYSNEIVVSLNNQVTVDITATKDTACNGETVELSATGIFDQVLWYNGSTENIIQVSNTGVYSITAFRNNCETDTSITITFLDSPLVNAGLDLMSTCEGILTLTGEGSGQLSWWEGEELLSDSSLVFVEMPQVDLVLTLKANENGCVSEDQLLIEADCISLFIPNCFTPNGDGVNDVFKVEARGIKQYEFMVFNRWGDKVFGSKDPDDVWTGGNPDYFVPDGVYTYRVIALDSKYESLIDDDHSRGTITIIR